MWTQLISDEQERIGATWTSVPTEFLYIWRRTAANTNPILPASLPAVNRSASPIVYPYREMNPNLKHHSSDICLCKTDKVDTAGRRLGRRLVVAFDGTQNKFGPEVREIR